MNLAIANLCLFVILGCWHRLPAVLWCNNTIKLLIIIPLLFSSHYLSSLVSQLFSMMPAIFIAAIEICCAPMIVKRMLFDTRIGSGAPASHYGYQVIGTSY